LRKVANGQTDKQTNKQRRSHNLLGGGKYYTCAEKLTAIVSLIYRTEQKKAKETKIKKTRVAQKKETVWSRIHGGSSEQGRESVVDRFVKQSGLEASERQRLG